MTKGYTCCSNLYYASESTFSSITPKIVEVLVCAHDWMRQPISVEENIDNVEMIEKGKYFNLLVLF